VTRSVPPRSGALSAAVYRIEQILGPREHPNVQAVIGVVRDALSSQARFIAHEARREAAAFQRDHVPSSGNVSLTYDGGLRRAARIAETQGEGP
jgi:hypothetical protein